METEALPFWCLFQKRTKTVEELDDTENDNFVFSHLADFWQNDVEVFKLN